MAIKAQELAEFINEAMPLEENEENWLQHVDGSSTLIGSRARVVFHRPKGDELEYVLKFEFKASNYKAKYKAPIAGIKMALDVGARTLIAYSDS
ncbi:UNVERIFIED_CONTAM: hypothetical protein Slati_0443000 [Sesamum latifolium]|uniref:Uncharacterized protein n=1 Tax=Sesamum latifolium TaxID=2727402 RepID=A0AAW2XVL2_9LAMI